MQQLEIFHYETALNLNMGYYTIRLSPAGQDMTKIVTEFGKFGYNRLPIGICVSWGIFKAKVDKLLGDIEGVKTNIYDILVLGKDSSENNMNQLIILFGGLRAAGLKLMRLSAVLG